MPDYEIEDSETGLKLVVSGDSPPSQEDADELIGDELSFLKTNLYEFPGGKFILDVGPNKIQADVGDAYRKGPWASKLFDDRHRDWMKTNPVPTYVTGESVDQYKKRVEEWSDMTRKFQEETKALASKDISPTAEYASRTKMADKMKPGTFLLIGHGSKKGGLYADEALGGHEFTVENIGKLLKEKSGSISNVINAACYGGQCEPKDFEVAFPNLSRVENIDTNSPNWMSISDQMAGRFFGGEGTNSPITMKWKKSGIDWGLENPAGKNPITESTDRK